MDPTSIVFLVITFAALASLIKLSIARSQQPACRADVCRTPERGFVIPKTLGLLRRPSSLKLASLTLPLLRASSVVVEETTPDTAWPPSARPSTRRGSIFGDVYTSTRDADVGTGQVDAAATPEQCDAERGQQQQAPTSPAASHDLPVLAQQPSTTTLATNIAATLAAILAQPSVDERGAWVSEAKPYSPPAGLPEQTGEEEAHQARTGCLEAFPVAAERARLKLAAGRAVCPREPLKPLLSA